MNRKTKRVSVAAAAVALLSVTGTAMAAPQCPETLDPGANYRCVFIDVGSDKFSLGTTKTGNFYELGLTGTLATSLYSLNGAGVIGVGSAVSDTNRKNLINAAGFNDAVNGGTTYSTIGGGTASVTDTAVIAQKNVDALNALGSGNASTQGLESSLGSPKGWRLTFDYLFTGILSAAGPSFTGGDIGFYFDDLDTLAVENTQVLRVNVTSSTVSPGNIDIFGKISFDFDNNGSNDCTTTFCQNFWNFQTSSPPDWYSLEGQGVEISFLLDTNVNPPFPVINDLAIGSNGAAGPFARQTTLDSSIRFNTVPEPTSIALVGLSLLGLAAGSARRNRKG